MKPLQLSGSLSRPAKVLGLGVLAIALLSACQQLGSYSNTRTYAPSSNLTGSRIYVYPFIDYIRDIVGYKLLREFDPRLQAGFSAVSIDVKLAMPSLGAMEVLPKPVNFQSSSFLSSELVSLFPTDAVVAAHADDERAFGATHRLIIIPAEVLTSAKDAIPGLTAPSYGVGIEGGTYTIRWLLVDVASNRVVLTTEYTENNKGDKNARLEERAQNWVDGLIEQMRLNGLLP